MVCQKKCPVATTNKTFLRMMLRMQITNQLQKGGSSQITYLLLTG